jgi:hypothetical protein
VEHVRFQKPSSSLARATPSPLEVAQRASPQRWSNSDFHAAASGRQRAL